MRAPRVDSDSDLLQVFAGKTLHARAAQSGSADRPLGVTRSVATHIVAASMCSAACRGRTVIRAVVKMRPSAFAMRRSAKSRAG